MLKQLILENWKSFRHAVLQIDPLTILIGTNSSGKSNVLEALEFLKRTVEGRDIQTALAGDTTLPSIRGGIEWAALKPETKFTLKVLVQSEDNNTDYLYSITVETKPQAQLLNESLVRQIKSPQNSDENIKQEILFQTNTPEPSATSIKVQFDDTKIRGEQEFRRYKSILGQLIYQSMESRIMRNTVIFQLPQSISIVWQSLGDIFILDPIPSKMRSYSAIYKSLQSDASNIAGVLAALPEEKKAEVESTLSAYVKDLPERDIQRVWAEPVGRLNSDAMLYCEEIWVNDQPPMLIDARGMSDGTLRFLGILTALLTRPEGSQLVIEDVDNGLHPSRSSLLVKMLREIGEKRQIDILVTTHNPALLDALGPEIVPFVVVAHRDSETGESKLTLLEDIENLPKLMASGSLGKLTTKGAIERSLSENR